MNEGPRPVVTATPPGGDEMRAAFRRVFPGVMFAMFLASVDQTILASALPAIFASLGGFAELNTAVGRATSGGAQRVIGVLCHRAAVTRLPMLYDASCTLRTLAFHADRAAPFVSDPLWPAFVARDFSTSR